MMSKFTDLTDSILEHTHAQEEVLRRLILSPTDTVLARSLPSSADSINDMANLYGCKHIVAFSSVFENVLGRVRDGELHADENVCALLLSCCDHITELASQLDTRDEVYLGHFRRGFGLIRQLHAYRANEHAAAAR